MKLLKQRESGFSLIELMVSIVIGALLLAGLVSVFKTSSDSYRELQKSGDLIENGRYAAELLYDDLRHAGFYGHFSDIAAFPAALPDPCEVANESNLYDGLAVPISGYNAPNYNTPSALTATTCDDKGFFTAADLQPNSDILIIRHASTALFAGTDINGANPVSANTIDGEVYIQSNAGDAEIKIANGTNSVNPSTSNADVKGGTTAFVKFPGKSALPYADVRKYAVHVYYVATCNAADFCTSADTPTLKRLELGPKNSLSKTSACNGNTCMNIVPLVEGVERFNVEYGIDNNPATVNDVTGFLGDGVPDTYLNVPATIEDYESIVSIRVDLLVRSLEPTQGYTDNKTYTIGTVGGGTTVSPGGSFKRNVYRFEIRPTNVAGRREIP